MSSYSPAAAAMLAHRYGYTGGPIGSYSLVGDRVAREMFGGDGCGCSQTTCRCAGTIANGSFGSLPTQGTGTMQLQPVLAAGVDTGTVELVPLVPDPALSGLAQEGVEMGFAEFMRDFEQGGR